MQAVTTIGLDIAKSVFQVHGIDEEGNIAHPPSAEAPLRAGVLPEAVAMPSWDRGLRQASLVARTQGARAYGAPDAAGLREAVRQAAEERCH
jgi:hypothetical protein